MLTVKQRIELRSKAKVLEPIVRIGKHGITDNVVEAIEKVLKKRKLIKLKFLKGSIERLDQRAMAMELAQKTNAEIIDEVGFVVVLYRR